MDPRSSRKVDSLLLGYSIRQISGFVPSLGAYSNEELKRQVEEMEAKLANQSTNPSLSYNERSLMSWMVNLKDRKAIKKQISEYIRLVVPPAQFDLPGLEQVEKEITTTVQIILKLVSLRDNYLYYDEQNLPNPLLYAVKPVPVSDIHIHLTEPSVSVQIVRGVFRFYKNGNMLPLTTPTLQSYYTDVNILNIACHHASLIAVAKRRLDHLSEKYKLHNMYNKDNEQLELKVTPNCDFYRNMKIDNHVHLSAMMSQEELLNYIKEKLRTEGDEPVYEHNGEVWTLRQVFQYQNIDTTNMNVNNLNMHADKGTFQRFDVFTARLNPFGSYILRQIFLKYDNYIHGRYLADIIKRNQCHLQANSRICQEVKISIHGKDQNEWLNLAQWYLANNLRHPNMKIIIQIPRLYSRFKLQGHIQNFEQLLFNVFKPLFDASFYPEQHQELNDFLNDVIAFDSADDESAQEIITSYSDYKSVTADLWDSVENPPYSHWLYYLYSNIYMLNLLRRAKGLKTFSLRPNSGEAGAQEHLSCSFLTAHSINQGLKLQDNPVMQYLFYICQIGISISPLANNKVFCKYLNNPFPIFFARGLNVTLSTNDPLMCHLTSSPLMEEYSVARQYWNFNSVDLSEIARNSVLLSGFSNKQKQEWLGTDYCKGTPESNDIEKTNLPRIRYGYRYETYAAEVNMLMKYAKEGTLVEQNQDIAQQSNQI